MFQSRANRIGRFLPVVVALAALVALAAGCSKPPIVTVRVQPADTQQKIPAGSQAVITLEIHGNNAVVTWTPHRGQISNSAGTSTTYTAPAEPGLDTVDVLVKTTGNADFAQSIAFQVVAAAGAPASNAPAAAPPAAAFTFPSAPGSGVNYQNMCAGTITNMPAGLQLWIVVQPTTGPNMNYHPQNGPAGVDTQGNWRNVCYFGGQGPAYNGLRFIAYAVLVDDKGAQEFKNYIKNAPSMNPPWDGMPTLPTGHQIVGTAADVVRQ